MFSEYILGQYLTQIKGSLNSSCQKNEETEEAANTDCSNKGVY